MKCEYCELRRVGPFVISKACTMLSGKLKNTAFCGIHPIDDQFAGGFARIGTGIQSVNTARQSTFPATGRTCDQNSLTRIDIQIDIC